MLPVYILAGGKGTRLGELTKDTPKCLVEVHGRPFLYYVLHRLAWEGVEDVVVCVKFQAMKVIAKFGFRQFGMRIHYSIDEESSPGTLGALRCAHDLYSKLGDRFLVMYGDSILAVDFQAAIDGWMHSGRNAMMTVCRSAEWAPPNVVVSFDHVTRYQRSFGRYCDYGLQGLTGEMLRRNVLGTDLSDLYADLAINNHLYAYEVTRRFYEINTPKSLKETSDALRR